MEACAHALRDVVLISAVCVCVCSWGPESLWGSLFAVFIVGITMATALAAQCEVERERSSVWEWGKRVSSTVRHKENERSKIHHKKERQEIWWQISVFNKFNVTVPITSSTVSFLIVWEVVYSSVLSGSHFRSPEHEELTVKWKEIENKRREECVYVTVHWACSSYRLSVPCANFLCYFSSSTDRLIQKERTADWSTLMLAPRI